MADHTFTTDAQVRCAFLEGWQYPRNKFPELMREEFAEFVAMLARDGHISEAIAQRVTL